MRAIWCFSLLVAVLTRTAIAYLPSSSIGRINRARHHDEIQASTQRLQLAVGSKIPVAALPAPLAAMGKTLLAVPMKVFRVLPLPLKLIATILTTLSFLVIIEDITDAIMRLRKGKVVEAVQLVRKPFIPTKSSVAIRFLQTGIEPVEYGCEVGAKLSIVAEDAAVPIMYDCRKGQCGTCSVKVGSKWIKTCQTSVPMPVKPGDVLEIIVPKATIKSSKFFSPRSFLDGVWNNALGMVGFVGQMRRADDQFQQRLAREKAIAERAKALKSSKEAGAGAGATA